MSVVINTNAAATLASANLASANNMLKKSLARLSSGSKIINASDDAGGVAVATRLASAAKKSGAVGSNIANALAYLQNQDSHLKVIEKMLVRMSELQSLHADSTKSTADKALYASEFTSLDDQIKAIQALNWNANVETFETGVLAVTVTNAVSFDIGQAAAYELNPSAAGASAIGNDVETKLAAVASARSQNGAQQNILGFYAELNQARKANFEAAISEIMDVDVAEESTQLARWSTLVQAGTAMVSQANGSSVAALSLLRS